MVPSQKNSLGLRVVERFQERLSLDITLMGPKC